MARLRVASAALREAPRLRVASAVATGTYTPVVQAIDNMVNVEPLTTLTMPLTLAGGVPADAWTSRVVIGAPVPDLAVTGSTLTFTAPADADGTQTTIGVTGTYGGGTTPEETFTVNVLPQIEWLLVADGTWQPLAPMVLL